MEKRITSPKIVQRIGQLEIKGRNRKITMPHHEGIMMIIIVSSCFLLCSTVMWMEGLDISFTFYLE